MKKLFVTVSLVLFLAGCGNADEKGASYTIEFYESAPQTVHNVICGEIFTQTVRCTSVVNGVEFNYGDVKAVTKLSK